MAYATKKTLRSAAANKPKNSFDARNALFDGGHLVNDIDFSICVRKKYALGSGPPGQASKVYDLCHTVTFLHVARVKKHTAMRESHACKHVRQHLIPRATA